MNEFILKECDNALRIVKENMAEFVVIDPYQEMFEAETPDIADKMKNNIIKKESTNNALLKAIGAVKKFIQNIIDSIANFCAELGLDKKEKDAFTAFKEKCRKDPALKNKKITIKDYQKLNADYDAMIKEIEENMEKVKRDEGTPVEALIDKATTFIGNHVSAVSTIVTADAAMKAAESNINMARDISRKLNTNQAYMNQLTAELGEKEAAKYKKKIEGLSKYVSLERVRAKLFAKKYNNMKECINDTLSQVQGLTDDSLVVQAKTAAKNPDLAMHFLNNETLKPTIKASGAAKKQAQKDIAAETIRGRVFGKNYRQGKGAYKSKSEFLFGKK